MKLPLSGMSHQQFSLQIQAIHLALMDCRGKILLLLHYSHKLVESGENYKLILSILKLHINSQPPLYIQVCTVRLFRITVSVSRVCVWIKSLSRRSLNQAEWCGAAAQHDEGEIEVSKHDHVWQLASAQYTATFYCLYAIVNLSYMPKNVQIVIVTCS